jgi:hypothetical protein
VLRVPIQDDAGTPVGLHLSGLWPTLRSVMPSGSAGGRGSARGQWIGAAISILLRGETLVLLAAAFLLGVIGLLMLEQAGTGMWLLLFSPIASSLLVAVCGSLFTLGMLGRRFRARVVRVQLQRNHCPACDYDLRSQLTGDPPPAGRADPAELIRCPECAAQWARERLGAAVDSPAQVIVISTTPPGRSD